MLLKKRALAASIIRLGVLIMIIFCLPLFSLGQVNTVTGTVLDDQGKPVSGASVIVKATMAGTRTNDDGQFNIAAAKNAVLVISYVGFESLEVPVNGRSEITITLKSLTTSLEDVVVVGYGTKIKRDVGGAVLSVDQKLLKDRPVTNTLSALQGTAPGLVITRTNGQPGREGINARIRGITSLGAGNAPLVIIDGIEGDINALNPNVYKVFLYWKMLLLPLFMEQKQEVALY